MYTSRFRVSLSSMYSTRYQAVISFMHYWLQGWDLWSILVFITSGSTINVVKTSEGKRPEDETGGMQLHGFFCEKYYNHSKEDKRNDSLNRINAKMETSQDLDYFLFVLYRYRDRLEEMGQRVHDEWYEGIILKARPAVYKRARNAIYEKGDLAWRHSTHGTRYIR